MNACMRIYIDEGVNEFRGVNSLESFEAYNSHQDSIDGNIPKSSSSFTPRDADVHELFKSTDDQLYELERHDLELTWYL